MLDQVQSIIFSILIMLLWFPRGFQGMRWTHAHGTLKHARGCTLWSLHAFGYVQKSHWFFALKRVYNRCSSLAQELVSVTCLISLFFNTPSFFVFLPLEVFREPEESCPYFCFFCLPSKYFWSHSTCLPLLLWLLPWRLFRRHSRFRIGSFYAAVWPSID